MFKDFDGDGKVETGDDDKIDGKGDGSSDKYAKYQNGLGWKGSKTDYGSVMKEYEKRAYQGIENGKYPKGMENIIKEYFSSFD